MGLGEELLADSAFESDFGYGECLFLLKVKDNKIIVIDECERYFKKQTEQIFNHIKFEMINEQEYHNLLEIYFSDIKINRRKKWKN